MTWTDTVQPGLGATVCTFVLTPRTGTTLLLVRDEIKRPRGIIRSPFSATEKDLNNFVDAIKRLAELTG